MSEDRHESHRSGNFRQVRYQNLSRRFRFNDGSVDAIYSSHVFEHLSRRNALKAATESFRVLRPGGIFRVAVPDLDDFISGYNPDQSDAWFSDLMEAAQTGNNRHQWMYNSTSMKNLLNLAGFQEVRRADFRMGQCPDLEMIESRPHSLFMEAWK